MRKRTRWRREAAWPRGPAATRHTFCWHAAQPRWRGPCAAGGAQCQCRRRPGSGSCRCAQTGCPGGPTCSENPGYPTACRWLKQCCGFGMIYSRSSYEFLEFRIRIRIRIRILPKLIEHSVKVRSRLAIFLKEQFSAFLTKSKWQIYYTISHGLINMYYGDFRAP